MQNMNDQAAATDLLLSAKSGVRNCAYAITEAASPNVRQALSQQLQQSVNFHEQVTDYMINKGYYHPYNLNEQVQVDQQAVQQTMQQQNAQQPNMAQQTMPQQNQ